MKFREKWRKCVEKNSSLVCVGLDTDPKRMPEFLREKKNSTVAFNREIIDATSGMVGAYKLNAAFYEAEGIEGMKALKQTRAYIPEHIPVILDGKRGDIGNTSKKYAQMIFEEFGFDATTVNPYLGGDSVGPFLEYEDKYMFVLCLTSNPGALDFQSHGDPSLYLRVAEFARKWNEKDNCGLVVGATRPEQIKEIREIHQEAILLVPGVGAQGGNVGKVLEYGGDNLVINSSRAIIYASQDRDFAQRAHEAATALRDEINQHR
jgi:orotidine-5'-phosphate decarboxylase